MHAHTHIYCTVEFSPRRWSKLKKKNAAVSIIKTIILPDVFPIECIYSGKKIRQPRFQFLECGSATDVQRITVSTVLIKTSNNEL